MSLDQDPAIREPNENHLPAKICRVCLVTNVRMVCLDHNDYQKQYEDVTGLLLSNAESFPRYLCWECVQHLTNSYKFKSRTVLTHCLLSGLLTSDNVITESNIWKINRYKNGLESKLSKHTINANHFDIELIEAQINNDIDSSNAEEKNSTENEPNMGLTELKIEVKDLNERFKDDIVTDIKKNDSEDVSADETDITENVESFPIEVKIPEEPKRKLRSGKTTNSSGMKLRNAKIAAKKVAKVKMVAKKVVKPTTTAKVRTKAKNEVRKKWKQAFSKKPVPFIILDSAIFITTNLNLDEQMEEIEKRKETDNYMYSVFKCEKCYKGFLDEEAFKAHMIRHTEQSGQYECRICKVRFQTMAGLRNHSSSHSQKFTCKMCPFITNTRYAAKLHEDFHKGTTYECKHCSEKFSKLTSLQNHVRIKHPSDIICELCGYSFVSHFGLHLHKKRKHQFDKVVETEEKHTCKDCNIDFVSDEALQTHMINSTKHTGESKEAVVKQRKTETKKFYPKKKPQEPIQCEQCDVKLPTATAYYQHFRHTHPDKTRTNYPSVKSNKCICEVCGRIFTRLALLLDHSSTHSENTNQFKCSHCGETFERRYKLIAHERKHTTQKQVYICVECGKGFTLAKNMKRHMLIHTGLKPFKCEICAKCFVTDGEKRAHVTHVHMKIPWPKRNRKRPAMDTLHDMEASYSNM